MLVALLDAERAARREAAALRPVQRIGRRAFDRRQALLARRVAVEPRRRVEQRPRVGMLRIGEERLRWSLPRPLRRAYMTTTRLADVGDDAKVVADQDDGGAEIGVELAQQVQDLRLDGDVERRGRLVGDEQDGLVGKPMASMTRWRMPPENWCGKPAMARSGAVMPMRPSSFDGARQRRRRSCRRGAPSPRPAGRPMRSTGLSEVIGSWKTIAILSPRSARTSSWSIATMSRPRKTISPLAIRLCSCSSRMIDSAVTLLPEPDSPTMPSVSREDLEADAVDRADDAASVSKCVRRSRTSRTGRARRPRAPASGDVPARGDRASHVCRHQGS